MSSCSKWKWLFPVVPFHCVLLPVAFVWDAHCSLREVSIWVVGLDLHTICWPLLCVCVTLRLLSSSIFNWIVWFCFSFVDYS